MKNNYKYFNGKRMVGGPAAFIHLVYSVYDGPDDYNRRLIEDALQVANKRMENDLKNSHLKLVE